MSGFEYFITETKGLIKDDFDAVVRAIFRNIPGHKAAAYSTDATSITLYWHKPDSMASLPFTMKAEQVIPFLWAWVENQ